MTPARHLTLTLPSIAVACLAVFSAIFVPAVMSIPADYLAKRTALIQSEQRSQTGGTSQTLNPLERLVDKLLMTEKKKLIEAARLNGSDFFVRHNFLNTSARAAMEATKAFQILKKMPKGGVLHVHDESITSIDWLVRNVTYRDNCYMCVTSVFNVKFHFFKTPPSDPDCVWRPVSSFRAESGNASAFDETLQKNISMVVDDPGAAYPDINSVWKKFMDYFTKVEGLMLYAPVFEDYLWEGLRQFREDNVQYLEIRVLLPKVYELDGTTHDSAWVLALYKRVITRFVSQYPDFTGARLIKASLRFKPADQIMGDVKEAMRMYTRDPDFMVGFDLVGQEDPLHPLLFYIDALLYPSRQNPPVHLPYFFHAGETDWQETASDYNLADALLLNTTRIGHGYALVKHPVLKEKIRQRGIAVEVNPISNQVLKLVDDPRNHPAAPLIAENFPLVISSDDPGFWEATPLTHDFYVTFMALSGEKAGLATLKQLALNSLNYSALTAGEKQKAISLWRDKWTDFIQQVCQDNAIHFTL